MTIHFVAVYMTNINLHYYFSTYFLFPFHYFYSLVTEYTEVCQTIKSSTLCKIYCLFIKKSNLLLVSSSYFKT